MSDLGGILDDHIERTVERLLERRLAELRPAEPEWVTAEECAEWLGWPISRIYKLTSSGAIPHVKHEGRLMFNTRVLRRWLLDEHGEGPRVALDAAETRSHRKPPALAEARDA